jgi:predicted ATPase
MGTNAHSRYLFKHALIQEAAYESILKSKRQQYHRHIAQVIEERFSEIARSQPELLARHYRQAALSSQAIRYLQAAAEKAVQRSANLEAITHLRTALALVGSINEAAQRAQQELALQIALGVPLIAMHGFASPQVESAYERARELCQEAGEVPQLFPASWGLWVFYTARGRHQTALELARQCLKIGERGNDEALKLEAHHALGVSLQVLGECRQALSELEQVIALYDPEKHSACAYTFGQDPGVVCRSHAALALWLLGYPDQARRVNAEALRLGEQVGHPYSLAAANNFGAMLHQMCGETAAVREKTEAAIALSTDRQFAFWMHIGRILRGWMLAAHPEDLEGIAEMSAGLKAFESTGAEILKPYFVALLAQAHARAGQPDIGLELLNTAQVTANRNQERWWEAELYRLKGELLLERKSGQAQQNLTEAQQCFSHAIEIARTQDAKGLELRATMSLTRLLSRRGERKKAYAILAPVYDWFTEGFDTADLRDAMEMLKQLSLI